jgi:hypothetical protein
MESVENKDNDMKEDLKKRTQMKKNLMNWIWEKKDKSWK